jgi:hypothetical protein
MVVIEPRQELDLLDPKPHRIGWPGAFQLVRLQQADKLSILPSSSSRRVQGRQSVLVSLHSEFALVLELGVAYIEAADLASVV